MGRIWSSRRGRVRVVSFLTAGALAAAGFGIQGRAQAAQYARLLGNQRRHAFAELTAAAVELDTALQKASYATTPGLFSSLSTPIKGSRPSDPASTSFLYWSFLLMDIICSNSSCTPWE